MAERRDSTATPNWLQPPVEQGGLGFYVEVLRERIWIVVGTFLLTIAVAVAYLVTADKVYEGEAQILVSPLNSDDPVVAALPVIHSSSDPTRDVETASELVTSPTVAELAQKELGSDRSTRSLLNDVSAQPVAQSSLVAITGKGSSPEEAADLANAFAEGVVTDRSRALHQAVEKRIEALQGQAEAGGGADVSSELQTLELYRSGDDPTLTVTTEAKPQAGAVSPRTTLTLAGAGLGGIVLGIVAAFAAQTLDPRLRREEQIRHRYRLPILSRVPREPGRRPNRPLGPASVSPPVREAYRTLRANLSVGRRRPGHPQTILITGSAPSEGKTTTAINLAASFALAGSRVVLIEADLRRPAIARALGLKVDRGIAASLLENVSLEDALVTTTPFGSNLMLLLADYEGGWMSELFSLRAAQRLIEDAREIADYVIFDSPPLTAVVDTLPLARQVDDVVIASRIGITRLDRLHELGELLASNDIAPTGFVLVGVPSPASSYYYYYEPEGAEAADDEAGDGREAGERPGSSRRAGRTR
jgi:capsular exopolysaccharide synthesis family protein